MSCDIYNVFPCSVLLRQNPHNVHEWMKRVKLFEGKPKEVICFASLAPVVLVYIVLYIQGERNAEPFIYQFILGIILIL